MFNFIKLFAFSAIFVISVNNKTKAQCANADFSSGNFTNWTGYTGDAEETLVNGTSAEVFSNVVAGLSQGTTNSLPSNTGQHTIITNTTLTDPNTGGLLKMTPPNGASSCRLGNDLCYDCKSSQKTAARLEYTFTVTPSNSIFTYQYAVVLQDPSGSGHTSTECPKFTTYILKNGVQVGGTCGLYEVTASSALPGFTSLAALSTVCSSYDNVIWKNWTTASVDLAPWMGQTLTIQFTTYDCTVGGHFGYAYISCNCGNLALSQQCSGTSDIITAPAGFSYAWSPSGATTQAVTVTTPVNGTVYSCTCTPVTGAACAITLNTTININPVTVTVNSPAICNGQTATLTATGAGYTYNWSNALGTAQTVSPAPTVTTNYTVTASEAGGCSNSAKAVVTVNPNPTGTTASTIATCGNSNGTVTVTPTVGTAPYTYVWSNAQTAATATGLSPGSYTVTITDHNGCSGTAIGTVTSNSSVTLNTAQTSE